jgi:hypothetical protein
MATRQRGATLTSTKEAAMNSTSVKVASTLVMVGSALAFIVVLFLDWHRTTVEITGVATVRAEDPGWGSWAALAGLAAIALVVANLTRFYRGIEPAPTFGIFDLVLGVAIVSATVAGVFSGGAQVEVATVGVEANTILWPAWLGLALACVVAVSAAVVALPEAWQPTQRPTPSPA